VREGEIKISAVVVEIFLRVLEVRLALLERAPRDVAPELLAKPSAEP
jgi:hypothetical protein